MPNPMQFPSPQFLAEHHDFVRRLALGLARDEASAEDLVQETWLAALVNGSHSIVNPRAWLATAMRRRAQNVARSEDIRRGHEAQAARKEASEDESMQERVTFQHSVVAAVLALDEPYRSVVLLRYFQDFSPAAIARRRKVPVATVRSQLSRAQAQLRAQLELREGGREEWCMALAGFLEHSKPALISSSSFAVVVGACMLAAGVGAAWMVNRATGAAVSEPIALAQPSSTPVARVKPALESARVAMPGPEKRVAIVTTWEGPSDEALDAKSLDQLCDMLIRVEDELRPRLLTPSAEVVAAWNVAHSALPMEFARVLEYPKTGLRMDSGVVGVRGGGAYYSFATRSNSYDDAPMVRWVGNELQAMRQTVLVDLGAIEPASVPAGLTHENASLFAMLSSGPALPVSGADVVLTAALNDLKKRFNPLVLHHTYLIRQVTENEHDVLAVFVPIQQDASGITLAWKILKSWPVPDRRTLPKNIKPRKVLAAEAWTAEMSTAGLLQLVDRIRVRTTARLTAIPNELRQKWPDRPLGRVLRDYFGTRYVDIEGGGRFFNFTTQSNSYQGDPEIDLEERDFSVDTWAPGAAMIVDIGVASVAIVGPSFALPNDAHIRIGWDQAWSFERRTPSPSGAGPMVVTPEEQEQFHSYADRHPVVATVGHSYLVRSIIPGKHDYLVCFEILDEDEHGIFITWKILKTWPA